MENGKDEELNFDLKKYKTPILIFIVIIILCWTTQSITKNTVEDSLKKEILNKVYDGYVKCINYCWENNEEYGSLVSVTREGTADCQCYTLNSSTNA